MKQDQNNLKVEYVSTIEVWSKTSTPTKVMTLSPAYKHVNAAIDQAEMIAAQRLDATGKLISLSEEDRVHTYESISSYWEDMSAESVKRHSGSTNEYKTSLYILKVPLLDFFLVVTVLPLVEEDTSNVSYQ